MAWRARLAPRPRPPLAAGLLLAAALAARPLQAAPPSTFAYAAWSDAIAAGRCGDAGGEPMQFRIPAKTGSGEGTITCSLEHGIKSYSFPAGVFEIDEQLLVPERVSITGSAAPNDMSDPTRSPNWQEQTLFLATRGVTDYASTYCHAEDMVKTRVGFVLSSGVSVRNLSYQGIDTIRPMDNGALCGGGAFETKGCAENDCGASDVNNGGSDGIGSSNVIIENVRVNDYYFAEDRGLIGAKVEGNDDCGTENWMEQCCFCKPNGVRSAQLAVWVPETRNANGTSHILIKDLVSRSTQADGINFHGYVKGALVVEAYIENTGDDVYVLWGADDDPVNVTFRNSYAGNPGILRPNWYGVCVATYGLESVVFENITCRTPTLSHPIPSPFDGTLKCSTTMFMFHGDFSASYPPMSNITIKCWRFEDLEGKRYLPQSGVEGGPTPRKMAWTSFAKGTGTARAPYLVDAAGQRVNVYVEACSDVGVGDFVVTRSPDASDLFEGKETLGLPREDRSRAVALCAGGALLLAVGSLSAVVRQLCRRSSRQLAGGGEQQRPVWELLGPASGGGSSSSSSSE